METEQKIPLQKAKDNLNIVSAARSPAW